MSQETLQMTPEVLQNLVSAAVTAAVQEMRKPEPPTEAQLAEIEQAQKMREETAQSVLEKEKNKKFLQSQCTHEHSKQAGGGTHAVHVRDNDYPADAGYIYCQLCEIRVRPEDDKWRKLDPNATFNTPLFNRLFQDCASGQGEMLG